MPGLGGGAFFAAGDLSGHGFGKSNLEWWTHILAGAVSGLLGVSLLLSAYGVAAWCHAYGNVAECCSVCADRSKSYALSRA